VPEPLTARAEAVRASQVTLVVFIALGCLAGWLWAQWADPANFVVTADNAVMGELEAGREFGVDVVYAVIAAVAGLLAGSLLGLRYGSSGWVLPVAVTAAALLAAVIAWRLGVGLGPPEPLSALEGAQRDDLVPERLDVHAKGLLLLWPMTALIGVLASVAAVDPKRRRSHPDGQ